MQQDRGEPVARWRACEPGAIVWVCWDDDFVAYHRPSGKTHFLNTSSHYLLSDLLLEPRDAEAVRRAFEAPAANTDGNTDDDSDDLQREVESLLDHFEQLGLIERV